MVFILPLEGVQSIVIFVCLWCLFARISQNPHVQTSQNSMYLLPVAVARSSSNESAVSYVLPV